MAVAKSVQVDISVSGDVESKRKLDSLDAKAEELKKAFPEYKLKIDSAAASAKIQVFKTDFKSAMAAVTRPQEMQVLSDKALAKLAGVRLKADELKRTFPAFTVQIDDRVAKLELDAFAAEAKVKLDAIDKRLAGAGSGGGGGILGKIGGLFGGGSAGAGGAGSAASSAGSGVTALPPPVLLGGAAAALAALPFIAQAAAGGITLALGGALAGLGIAGAQGTAKVQKAFTGLKTGASADLKTIGTSFVPVMAGIYTTAQGVLKQLTPVFAAAAKTISGPFQAFGQGLAKAFASPAVKTSIGAVATAFGAILKAVTPGLAADIGDVANGIKNIANSIAAHPQAIAGLVSGLFKIAGGALNIISSLTRVANWIEAHWNVIKWIVVPVIAAVQQVVAHWGTLSHETAVIFDGIRHDIARVWDLVFSNSIGSAIRIGHNVEAQWNSFRHATANIYNGVRGDIATAWNTIWNNTVTRVSNGITAVVNWFKGLPGKAVSALGNAGTVLSGWGGGVIRGLLSGMTGIIGTVWNFIKGIPGKILSFLGIKSPPQWAIDAGKHIMGGIGIGMAQAQTALQKASVKFTDATSAAVAGSGVQRWAPTVSRALAMEALPANLLQDVLYQMQTESGGNPRAINLTDINAQQGDPSRGLMQVIATTFAAYHWPGTSWDIYDPLANIAAAINYAAHGRGFGSGPGQVGSGHGYAAGTAGAAPGWGWVGERGPELVKFRGGEQVLPATQLGGYASGTAGAGAEWLKAWQGRRGGGWGSAWGPVPVNEQIAEMTAAVKRATTLAGAGGLSAGQHRFWSATAADEKKRLGVLGRELATERAWRGMLGRSDATLAAEIAAAGSIPSLRKNAAAWKAQIARQKATITQISAMLGYSDAQRAAIEKALPKPVPTGVLATHVYGGDVANTIAPVLAAALGPFTGTAATFDNGGTLRPGWNAMLNKTGRPEQLVPARSALGGGGRLELLVSYDGSMARTGLSQEQLRDIRYTVRTVGGGGPGAVERTFASR